MGVKQPAQPAAAEMLSARIAAAATTELLVEA